MTTTKEQVTTLGNVKFRPMQRDMFTGELTDKKPKAGNGSHIRLAGAETQPPAVPGMASFAGTGPKGKYCRDCAAFGDVAVQRPNGKTQEVGDVEMNRGGCVIWASRMGHAKPLAAKTISLCDACDLFSEPNDIASVRRFIISPAGTISRVLDFPINLKSHRPDTKAEGLADRPPSDEVASTTDHTHDDTGR